MKLLGKYYIVTRRNGKQKLYTQAKYRLLTAVKVTGTLLGVVLIMLMLCGMVIADNNPFVGVQITFIVGIFAEVAICTVFNFIVTSIRERKHSGKGNKNV